MTGATTTRTVAVLGFHSDAAQKAALERTFASFARTEKTLFLYPSDREGDLYTLSLGVGDAPVACIHPDYSYPVSYLDELARACDPAMDAVWTADRAGKTGLLEQSNPDIYQSLIPAQVLRQLFSSGDRHIPLTKRSKRSRAVQLHVVGTSPVQTNGALPRPLHELNGLYWLVDYAYRMDRRCIEAYLDMKKLGRDNLALEAEAYQASLKPLQLRHLRFFLSSNRAGTRAVDYIANHIDFSTVKHGLDVGSGYGGLVKALLDRGCAATGLEIMQSLTDLAKINLHGRDARFIVGDFLKEKLPEESYDLITMTDVIEHVASAEEAMAITAKLLRPGGYAYIKVPNYRYIDHVREDAHTGLFGITLLRHDPAAAYLKAAKNMGYSVGDYHDYDYYIRTFAKHGVRLVRADNVQSKMEELPKLVGACKSGFAKWETEMQIDAEMKTNIRNQVTEYLRVFEEKAKPQRSWCTLFRAKPDPLFLRDYMTAHWNLFFQKPLASGATTSAR